jgi:hypothetical protein
LHLPFSTQWAGFGTKAVSKEATNCQIDKKKSQIDRMVA